MVPALVFHNHLKNFFNLFVSSDLRGLRYIDHKKVNLFVVKTPRIFGNYLLIPFKLIIILFQTIYFNQQTAFIGPLIHLNASNKEYAAVFMNIHDVIIFRVSNWYTLYYTYCKHWTACLCGVLVTLKHRTLGSIECELIQIAFFINFHDVTRIIQAYS